MAKSPLAAAVAAQITNLKLSKAAAAKQMGVGVPGLATLLKGKSRPNAATMPKYAKFLGVTVEEVAKMAGRAPRDGEAAKAPAKGRRGRPAKAASGRRPGRPAKAASTGVSLDEAVALAGDALAVAVHRADAATRELLARLVRA